MDAPGATLKRQTFNALLAALSNVFSQEGRLGGDIASKALRSATQRPYGRRASKMKPGPLLAQACALENALPEAGLALACSDLLDWEHWQGDGLANEISSSLYTTELIGPDGHVEHGSVRVGLLVSDAGTDYPLSSHAGEETYYVIAGEAEWVIEGSSYLRRPPGTFIHHPAWKQHGRRTMSEPFLGAWRWTGDLDLSSFKVTEFDT